MTILAVENVSLSFGGLCALANVSVSVGSGEIVGIIGPNGAGKTTLLNVICGINRPDQGQIRLDGMVITGRRPSDIAGMGLGRTFQASQLFPGMSVLENMMTGLHLRSVAGVFATAFRTRRMRAEESEMWRRAMEALEFVGLPHYADRSGSALSFGEQRIIEIARCLISEPKVVLLDEPAVGLSVNRVDELNTLLRRIRNEKAVTLVMIEHVVRLVMDVSDRIVVLNSGAKIADGTPDEVCNNPDVIQAYLGRQIDAGSPQP